MQPDPTITITCDELVDFEEDAAAFAQGPVEFVSGAALAPRSAWVPSAPPLLSNEKESKESA